MNNLSKLFSIVLVICLSASCSSDLTDSSEFSLHYYDAEVIVGNNVILNPTYHGTKPTDFRIYGITRNGVIFYEPLLDGELIESDSFYVKNIDGTVIVSNTAGLKTGIYKISLSCSSDGNRYDFSELITIKMVAE